MSAQGRLARSIAWGAKDYTNLQADENTKLLFQKDFVTGEEYICEIVNGRERARHNVRYISSIYWAEPW